MIVWVLSCALSSHRSVMMAAGSTGLISGTGRSYRSGRHYIEQYIWYLPDSSHTANKTAPEVFGLSVMVRPRRFLHRLDLIFFMCPCRVHGSGEMAGSVVRSVVPALWSRPKYLQWVAMLTSRSPERTSAADSSDFPPLTHTTFPTSIICIIMKCGAGFLQDERLLLTLVVFHLPVKNIHNFMTCRANDTPSHWSALRQCLCVKLRSNSRWLLQNFSTLFYTQDTFLSFCNRLLGFRLRGIYLCNFYDFIFFKHNNSHCLGEFNLLSLTP